MWELNFAPPCAFFYYLSVSFTSETLVYPWILEGQLFVSLLHPYLVRFYAYIFWCEALHLCNFGMGNLKASIFHLVSDTRHRVSTEITTTEYCLGMFLGPAPPTLPRDHHCLIPYNFIVGCLTNLFHSYLGGF